MVDVPINDVDGAGLRDELNIWHVDAVPKGTLGSTTLKVNPFEAVKSEISNLDDEMLRLIDTKPSVLKEAAGYFWNQREGGKKIRPAVLFLIAKSLPGNQFEVIPQQRRLACITEMIHTASLFHDDVIDKGEIRRGNKTANKMFGNKMAILGGDFLLAKASVSLARLRNLEVVEIMSGVIEHLVRGEVMQIKGEGGVEGYLGKVS